MELGCVCSTHSSRDSHLRITGWPIMSVGPLTAADTETQQQFRGTVAELNSTTEIDTRP